MFARILSIIKPKLSKVHNQLGMHLLRHAWRNLLNGKEMHAKVFFQTGGWFRKKLLAEKKYQVVSVIKKQAKRRSNPPFTTSSIQQEAARKLGFSASRTMMVFHTTPERATEAFGLYALSGKATTYLGTMGIALVTLISGSQRLGIAIPLIALFGLGMVFLKWVKPMGERV
jgi:hypothetical protein